MKLKIGDKVKINMPTDMLQIRLYRWNGKTSKIIKFDDGGVIITDPTLPDGYGKNTLWLPISWVELVN